MGRVPKYSLPRTGQSTRRGGVQSTYSIALANWRPTRPLVPRHRLDTTVNPVAVGTASPEADKRCLSMNGSSPVRTSAALNSSQRHVTQELALRLFSEPETHAQAIILIPRQTEPLQGLMAVAAGSEDRKRLRDMGESVYWPGPRRRAELHQVDVGFGAVWVACLYSAP